MRSMRRAALLLAGLLAACSGSGKVREPNKLVEFKSTANVEVRWHQDIGSARGTVLQPAVTQDAVYAANGKGGIFRLDRATGKEVWRADCDFVISGGVGAGEGLVLVGGEKGDMAAYGEDGKLHWKVRVSSEVLSAPQVGNGIVVVRTSDGRIAGLSVTDGSRQWLYERATPALIVRNHAGVLVKEGMAFAGFPAGKLEALRLVNGTVAWEAVVSLPRGNTELERISDITSLPVLDREQICAVAFQGNIACFDTAQGNLLWSRQYSSDKGLALSGRILYLTDAEGVVSALDKATGASMWKNDQLTLRRVSGPCVQGEHIAVGDYEGYLHVLSKEDGAMSARIKMSGAINTTPVALDDGLLVQTSSGDLYSVVIH